MKKSLIAILLAVLMLVSVANAKEETIEVTVKSVTEAIDTNGNPYTRLICTFEREQAGVKYKVDLPVMAFGDKVAEVAGITEGTTLKAIVQNRILSDGRESYSIIKVLP